MENPCEGLAGDGHGLRERGGQFEAAQDVGLDRLGLHDHHAVAHGQGREEVVDGLAVLELGADGRLRLVLDRGLVRGGRGRRRGGEARRRRQGPCPGHCHGPTLHARYP